MVNRTWRVYIYTCTCIYMCTLTLPSAGVFRSKEPIGRILLDRESILRSSRGECASVRRSRGECGGCDGCDGEGGNVRRSGGECGNVRRSRGECGGCDGCDGEGGNVRSGGECGVV